MSSEIRIRWEFGLSKLLLDDRVNKAKGLSEPEVVIPGAEVVVTNDQMSLGINLDAVVTCEGQNLSTNVKLQPGKFYADFSPQFRTDLLKRAESTIKVLKMPDAGIVERLIRRKKVETTDITIGALYQGVTVSKGEVLQIANPDYHFRTVIVHK